MFLNRVYSGRTEKWVKIEILEVTSSSRTFQISSGANQVDLKCDGQSIIWSSNMISEMRKIAFEEVMSRTKVFDPLTLRSEVRSWREERRAVMF